MSDIHVSSMGVHSDLFVSILISGRCKIVIGMCKVCQLVTPVDV